MSEDHGVTQRHVELEGCFNLRDLGGYATLDGRHTRWGRLYRSDALHTITEADARVLEGIGLRTVVDLRGFGELKNLGEFPLERLSVDLHHVPLFPTVREWTARIQTLGPNPEPGAVYLDLTEAARDELREVVSLLARPATYPAAFHCTAGRDRTGILAALVLSSVGVPDETIVEDYVLTQRAVDAELATGIDHALSRYPIKQVVAEDMIGFLSGLHARWGSAPAYLADIGVTPDELAALATNFLE